jgi:hypothetical protein
MAIDAVADEDKDPANESLSHSVRGATSGQVGRASPLRGLPATTGVVRRFPADSRAGSARDAKKAAVVCAQMATKDPDLQVL